MSKHLELLDVYTNPQPVDVFISHVASLHYVTMSGEVTIGSLYAAIQKKFEGREDLLAASKEFYEYQLENGNTDETVVFEASEDEEDNTHVFHFNFFTIK